MLYSDNLIEEIRSSNDIVDIISTYINLKKQGSSYFGLCPFHSEKSPSFSVSRDKQMYYCFGCGAGGNVYTFLMEYENYTFPEALRELAKRAGITVEEAEQSPEAKRAADYRSTLLEMNKTAAGYFYYLLRTDKGKKAYDYLINRGITDDIIKKFGLGYADIYNNDLYQYLKKKGYSDLQLKDSGLVEIDEVRGGYDKFWNRVMFPIMDVNNKAIGFGGRVMGEGKPKYLNSKETAVFDKSRTLYGLNFARTSRKKNIIICEGYMDVIAMHQAGFQNAVASLGTAFTSQQAMLLKRYTSEVILAYDSDEAGTKAALRAIPILKDVGISVRVLKINPYKDPDEFIKANGTEAFQERLDQAVGSFMFEIEVLSREFNQNDPESKTKFQHEAASKLASIEEILERTNYIEAVANHYYIGIKELTGLVNYYGTNGAAVKAAKESQTKDRRPKEDGKQQVQKLLLTWLVNKPILFEHVKELITCDDFIEPMYHAVAKLLFAQYEESKSVMPAKIINQFTDLAEQKEIASIFNTTLKLEPMLEDNNKAVTDIVKRVKGNSIDYQLSQSNDIEKWQQLIKEKADLEKLYISL